MNTGTLLYRLNGVFVQCVVCVTTVCVFAVHTFIFRAVLNSFWFLLFFRFFLLSRYGHVGDVRSVHIGGRGQVAAPERADGAVTSRVRRPGGGAL